MYVRAIYYSVECPIEYMITVITRDAYPAVMIIDSCVWRCIYYFKHHIVITLHIDSDSDIITMFPTLFFMIETMYV